VSVVVLRKKHSKHKISCSLALAPLLVQPAPMASPPLRLVFIGGGHSHVLALKSLAQDVEFRKLNVEVILVSNYPTAYYSGMLPGCIAGLYTPEQVQIFLEPFCKWAGIQFIKATANKIIAEEKKVFFEGDSPLTRTHEQSIYSTIFFFFLFSLFLNSRKNNKK
jgi:hypothetical protein